MHLIRAILGILLFIVSLSPAIAVDLRLNFSILGEVNRMNELGFGGARVNVTTYCDVSDDPSVPVGQVESLNGFNIGPGEQPWNSWGVFSGFIPSIAASPQLGWWKLDNSFSIPFKLPIGSDQLDIEFHADGVRLVCDFADSLSYGSEFPGSPLLNDVRAQGLLLNSITLADGQPLSSVGLAAVFIQPETGIFNNASNSVSYDSEIAVFSPGVVVIAQDGLGLARTRVAANSTQPLFHFELIPEPYPLVGDYASTYVRNLSGPVWHPDFENFAIYKIRTAPSKLRITNKSEHVVYMEWESNDGEGFAIQRSFDMVNWTTIKNFVRGAAGTTSFIDYGLHPNFYPNLKQGFYRVIVNPYIIP